MPHKRFTATCLPPLSVCPAVGDQIMIACFGFLRGDRLVPATVTSIGVENVATILTYPPRRVFGEPPPSPYRPFRRRDLISLDGKSFAITQEREQHLRDMGFRSSVAPLLEAMDELLGELELAG